MSKKVFAISTNYNKVANDQLSVAEWNELSNDFLAKSGGIDGVMSGELNANGRISNVGNLAGTSDVITKNYIDSISASAGGGTIFTNWGRSDCPTGTTQLYNGFGFGSNYKDIGGGSNNLCLQSALAGPSVNISALSSDLFPLTTAPWSFYTPAEISPTKTIIKCSVCYKSVSTCYVKFGSDTCDSTFNVAYNGYSLGALSSNLFLHASSKERICVNKDFDNTVIPGTFADTASELSMACMYATRVEDNLGLTDFSEKKYIECAVCCN